MLRVFVDTAGRPSQVVLQKSSGFSALDEEAMSAEKAARFRPYIEGGVPQPVWVVAPFVFKLQ
jgi:protein TonB